MQITQEMYLIITSFLFSIAVILAEIGVFQTFGTSTFMLHSVFFFMVFGMWFGIAYRLAGVYLAANVLFTLGMIGIISFFHGLLI